MHDRRKRAGRSAQLWRYLSTGIRLMLKHPIPSVAVVPLLADGRVVLVRRVDNDRWVVPGGMIDWGEDVAEAAERELEEETGLRLTSIRRILGVYSAPGRDPRVHAISISVVAEVEGEPSIHDPLEVSEIRAFEPEDLPFGYTAHDTGDQLRDFLDGVTALR
ncbi:MAG: NUDIX domain-containing protein [Gemmatimonadota bacterium]|jgi:ADP-ribose pyrophosphatase YjhB (NUDIX family)|nr:NUDIX domain-containing protein [Gemmatimonadota bacterium]